MPNINAVVGASVTGWCAGEQVTEEQKALAARLLGTFGTAVEVPEKFMGIVGAIGGAAPAYTYLYINALAEAAVQDLEEAETAAMRLRVTMQVTDGLAVSEPVVV